MPPGCLAIALALLLALLLPFALADAMLSALAKLGLSPAASLLAALAILVGGTINIPVARVESHEPVVLAPRPLYGMRWLAPPQWTLVSSQTVIAVNVGGCVIPCLLASYELLRLAAAGVWPLAAGLLAAAVNVNVCHRVARPIPGLGIAMPPIVPALTAAASALLLHAELAPPIAFVSGVLGPLIGADVLNLRGIGRLGTGVASIGGAGTFDGIVLSGLVATLLV